MPTLKFPVTASDHSQGNQNAKIILVEYGDYQCPYCGAAHKILKRLQSHYAGELLLVFRNFPLVQIHPEAQIAAETAEFAAEKGRFWEMHDLIYENQEDLSLSFLLDLADKLRLPVPDLEMAIEEGKYDTKIENDFSGGVRSGVNGTPTFFINGQRHNGPFQFEDLVAAIDRNLQ